MRRSLSLSRKAACNTLFDDVNDVWCVDWDLCALEALRVVDEGKIGVGMIPDPPVSLNMPFVTVRVG